MSESSEPHMIIWSWKWQRTKLPLHAQRNSPTVVGKMRMTSASKKALILSLNHSCLTEMLLRSSLSQVVLSQAHGLSLGLGEPLLTCERNVHTALLFRTMDVLTRRSRPFNLRSERWEFLTGKSSPVNRQMDFFCQIFGSWVCVVRQRGSERFEGRHL